MVRGKQDVVAKGSKEDVMAKVTDATPEEITNDHLVLLFLPFTMLAVTTPYG